MKTMITSVLLMKASFTYFELKFLQVNQYTVKTDHNFWKQKALDIGYSSFNR